MEVNMPLTATSLSGKMLDNLKQTFKPEDDSLLKAMCDSYAKAIVEEFTSNAIVTSSNVIVNGGASGLAPYVGPVIAATGVLSDGKIV
jgi:hypothetical protein